jgi:uncharacterized peroxidase-related enzyme
MTNFTAYTIETAPDAAKPLLEGIQNGYGFVPNLFAYMAEAPVTIEAYVALDTLIAKSSLSASEAQLALLTVSFENECGFCSVAHQAMAKKSGVNPTTIDALVNKTEVVNDRDKALVEFTRTIVQQRGHLSDTHLENFFAAGYTKQQVFEMMLVVSLKTLSNYTNHLTKPEPNPELLAML